MIQTPIDPMINPRAAKLSRCAETAMSMMALGFLASIAAIFVGVGVSRTLFAVALFTFFISMAGFAAAGTARIMIPFYFLVLKFRFSLLELVGAVFWSGLCVSLWKVLAEPWIVIPPFGMAVLVIHVFGRLLNPQTRR